jgi:hypothetical protein
MFGRTKREYCRSGKWAAGHGLDWLVCFAVARLGTEEKKMKPVKSKCVAFCLFALFAMSGGCSFGEGGPKSAVSASGWEPGQTTGGVTFSPSNLTDALSSASRILVQRLPTAAEQAQAAQGVAQYEVVIRQYLNDPVFVNTTMKTYFNDIFEMQGTVNINQMNVNREEPTNLARFIIQNNGDYRDILKSTNCYNNALAAVPCSSFTGNAAEQANRAAGAITTQAFLSNWIGPHSFRRVRKTFQAFACSDYPDGSDQGMTAAEIASTATGSTANFNTTVPPEPNGLICYSCHNNINARAALFLNYNRNGVYVPSGAGTFPANLPTNTVPTEVANRDSKIGDLLVATGGVYPIPRYKGQQVQSIRDYAIALADSSQFKSCTAKRYFNFMMGRPKDDPLPGSMLYLEQVVQLATTISKRSLSRLRRAFRL